MQQYIQAAIARVQLAYEALQQRAPGEKLYIAYSGGKDSECIVQACRDAVGIGAMEAHYHATGIDPPELVRHVKQQLRRWMDEDMECHFDKPEANMHDLITKKGPPRRLKRYCCEYLKEGKGQGRMVVTGVRWAESTMRRKGHDVMTVMSKYKKLRAVYNDENDIQRRIMEHCTTRSRITINPIVDWSNRQVWQYIREKELAYCSLYDEGFNRLGCIGCPMAGKGRYKEFARWPHMKRYYMRSFSDMLDSHPEYADKFGWRTAEDVFHWWMEDGVILGQIEMDL